MVILLSLLGRNRSSKVQLQVMATPDPSFPRLKREAGTGVRDPLEEKFPFYVRAPKLKLLGAGLALFKGRVFSRPQKPSCVCIIIYSMGIVICFVFYCYMVSYNYIIYIIQCIMYTIILVKPYSLCIFHMSCLFPESV